MKRLLFILLLIPFIGCGTEADLEPEFNPYTIGSFLFEAPEKAVYIGVKGKTFNTAQEDTVIIETPDGNSIVLTKGELKNQFEFTYIDSSISFQMVRDQNISISDTQLDLPESQEGIAPFNINGKFHSANDDRLLISYGFIYQCETTLENSDRIGIRFFQESGAPFRYYIIRTSRFEEALDTLVC